MKGDKKRAIERKSLIDEIAELPATCALLEEEVHPIIEVLKQVKLAILNKRPFFSDEDYRWLLPISEDPTLPLCDYEVAYIVECGSMGCGFQETIKSLWAGKQLSETRSKIWKERIEYILSVSKFVAKLHLRKHAYTMAMNGDSTVMKHLLNTLGGLKEDSAGPALNIFVDRLPTENEAKKILESRTIDVEEIERDIRNMGL